MTNGLRNETRKLINILNAGILDENAAVSEISAEMLSTPYIDWSHVHRSSIESLLHSRSLKTRMVAIRILGEWRNIDRLIKILETEPYDDRTKAGEALSLIGSPAIPALKRAQKSSNIQFVKEATWVLNTINLEEETKSIKILDDDINCPKCKSSNSITLKDELKIIAARKNFTFRWLFSKNKQKVTCSFCGSSIYLNGIPLQDWIEIIYDRMPVG